MMLSLEGETARSEIRPPILVGPASSQRSLLERDSIFVCSSLYDKAVLYAA